MSAKAAILSGFNDYCEGRSFGANPYSEYKPTHAPGYHGSKYIGVVRIAIDEFALWNIGWNVADILEAAKGYPNGVVS